MKTVSAFGNVMFVGGVAGSADFQDTIYRLGCITGDTCAWEKLDATLSKPMDNVSPHIVPQAFLDCHY